MSDTAVKTQDNAAATDALRIRFGSYILHGSRQNPLGATNAVLLAWSEEPVRSQDLDNIGFLPTYRHCHTVDAVVNEVAVFINRRREWAQGLVDSFASNLDVLTETLVEDVAEQNRNSVLKDTAALNAVSLGDIERAVDEIEKAYEDEPSAESFQSADDDLRQEAYNGEVRARERLGALGIVDLRKRSKGIIKGGYSLKKPALIDALIAVGDLGL